MKTKALQLNYLPALTWNKLKMNAGELREAPSCNTAVETRFESLPAGTEHRTLTKAAADAWVSEHAPKQTPERFVAGKAPVYHEQAFGTSAGAQFAALLEEENQGVELLEIADGVRAPEPIQWEFFFQDGNRAVSEQILHLGRNAEATIVMSLRSDRTASGFAGLSTRVVLEEGAVLHLSRVQLLGEGYTAVDDLGISQSEGAQMTLVQIELGAAQAFAGAEANLIGKKSSFTVKNGYLAAGEQKLDLNYNVIQRGKKTKCDMTFDGVLLDRADKILRDTIDFRNGSCGSAGHEQENVLLLSPDIVNRSMPVILCEEEDIEGSHGATIGQLADDMLFYLETRGVDRRAAEEMMVRASLGAVAREVPDQGLRDAVKEYIESVFAQR